MKEKMKVLITYPAKSEHLAQIQAVSPDIEVLYCPEREKMNDFAPEVEVVAAWFIPRDFVGKAKKLKWMQAGLAGVDYLLVPELVNSEIILTNSRGIHGIPMAEYTFGVMLNFTRQFPQMLRDQAARRWERFEGGELCGKTLAIIGLGTIGREIARKGKAFDMHVIGVKRQLNPVPYVDELLPPEALYTALAKADFVVLTVPLTPETRGMIGEGELRAMKPSAYLINISRGRVVQEKALIRALREGWIRGAGLDVYENEPLPPQSELYDLPNVIMTPHLAATTDRYFDRVTDLFCANLARYLKGEPLENVIDKKLGY